MRRASRLAAAAIGVMVAVSVALPSITETAAANGDTRTIYFYHTHTGESIAATFRVNGHYDPAVLKQLNHFLRDWRNNDETTMDPRLFDTLWEVYRRAGATQPIQIYSAYRSPETNAMLRRRSRAVAEHSQHMLGKAMDTTIPGFDMYKVREVGMQLQRGGVGWYPSANFVHLDVGGVRSWPRMPYDELARLFPDGKTVHVASNGQTLPGYEQARTEIAERGGTDLPPSQESGGFFAWLFSGFGSTAGTAREDEEDRRAPAAPAPVAVAAAMPAPVRQAARVAPAAMAYAEPGAVAEKVQFSQPAARDQVAALEPTVAVAARPAVAAIVEADLPLPPRRPAELSVAAADIPLPPIRPVALAGVQAASLGSGAPGALRLRGSDAIGNLITATASGVPMVRRSRLPAIITQGSAHAHVRLPGQAMAFAETDATDAVATDAVPRSRFAPSVAIAAAPAPAAPATGLRTAALRQIHRAAPASLAKDDGPTIAGAHLTGLRKAARQMAAGGQQTPDL